MHPSRTFSCAVHLCVHRLYRLRTPGTHQKPLRLFFTDVRKEEQTLLLICHLLWWLCLVPCSTALYLFPSALSTPLVVICSLLSLIRLKFCGDRNSIYRHCHRPRPPSLVWVFSQSTVLPPQGSFGKMGKHWVGSSRNAGSPYCEKDCDVMT